MFRQRLLSALVGIPLVVLLIWQGGVAIFVAIIFISSLALREFYTLCSLENRLVRTLGYAGNILLLTVAGLANPEAYFFALIVFFIVLNLVAVFAYPQDYQELMILLWGALYITSLLAFFLWLRATANGFLLLLSVLVTTWASDTGAYACGLTLGCHKLIPAVSPKKSLEGAVGGLLFAAAAMSLVFAPLLNLNPLTALLLGVAISFVGQCGDLAESALKRRGKIKDSGKFLPGHGGVLDRLDSLLFAVPVGYYLLLALAAKGGI